MEHETYRYRAAIADFRAARQRAALQAILARLTGKSIALLSYEVVARQLKAGGSAARGLQEIPLEAIVGSVGRYGDFTRTFLPQQDSDEARWATVMALASDARSSGLPPIQVYKIDEAYFVLDGHHRVSAARQMGATHIEAYVIEVRTKVPLTPDVQPDDLIVKAEHVEFLEYTRLDEIRPSADVSVSAPGQYEKLRDLIAIHRYALALEQQRAISLEEAVADWHDQVYFPVVELIRERGLLRDFPGRTETDVYLWIAEHHAALEEELGWEISPDAAVKDIAARFEAGNLLSRAGSRILDAVFSDALRGGPAPGKWREEKLMARYSDRLFADILVPVSGEEMGWHALEQALVVAQRESARLYGLYVVSAEAQKDGETAQAVRAEFDRRCETAGISGNLAVEAGEIAATICKRAGMMDLVILNLAYPPPSQPLARLGSGFRAIIRRCAPPVLVAPRTSSPLERVLLAYDGSAKAKEALFVAAYWAEQWKTPLVVVTVQETGRTTAETLDYARTYLEFHEVQAEFLEASGPVAEVILQTAAERASQLIILGGYGAGPVREMVVGTAVDEVLRGTRWPALICR